MLTLTTAFHILTLLAVCACAVTALTDEDLEKFLTDATNSEEAKPMRGYPDLEELGELKDRLEAIESLDNSAENAVFGPMNPAPGPRSDGVRKRPFCNGFTGCGRVHGKRASDSSLLEKLVLSDSSSALQTAPAVSKRPFCNGFFGCGNPGKRIVFRNANLVNRGGFGGFVSPRSSAKRFFCNPGAFGCRNPGKRAAYRAWMDGLRSQLQGGSGMPSL